MPESRLRDHLDHLWDMVGVVLTDILRFTHLGENGQGTCFKASGECLPFDLRIVVETAQKPALRPFWKLLGA